MTDKNDEISEEEQKAIEADIAKARSSLVSKEMEERLERVKQEATAQATKEAEIKHQLEESQRKQKELEEQMRNKEAEYAKSFDALKSKVDEMTSSKAPVNIQDPFKQPTNGTNPNDVDSWDDEKVDQVEEESARAFFGDGYDERA